MEVRSIGRVITESEGSDKTTHFAYDERGRVKRRILPSGVAIDSIYDGIDRLLEMKSSDGTIHYQYFYTEGCPDPVEIVDLIHHTSLQREYNDFGQIVHETNPMALPSHGNTTITEDAQRALCLISLPSLISIKEAISQKSRRHSPSGKLLYSHRYADFDPNGHVTQEELIHQPGHSEHNP